MVVQIGCMNSSFSLSEMINFALEWNLRRTRQFVESPHQFVDTNPCVLVLLWISLV